MAETPAAREYSRFHPLAYLSRAEQDDTPCANGMAIAITVHCHDDGQDASMILCEKLPVRGTFKGFENSAWYRYCAPEAFYPLAGELIPLLAAAAMIALAAGLYLGLFAVSLDAHQGEAARILFIHVPAHRVSMLLCLFTATFAAIGLAFNARLAAMATMALAPTGLTFAFLDIWTGCIWNKAVSGDWWQPNPGTFSALALALFYLGFIVLHTATEDWERANKACVLLLLAGAVSILVDFASMQSWTAQQPGTLPGTTGEIRLGTVELASLLMTGLGFLAYGGAAALLRLRCVILERECRSMWVAQRQGRSAP